MVCGWYIYIVLLHWLVNSSKETSVMISTVIFKSNWNVLETMHFNLLYFYWPYVNHWDRVLWTPLWTKTAKQRLCRQLWSWAKFLQLSVCEANHLHAFSWWIIKHFFFFKSPENKLKKHTSGPLVENDWCELFMCECAASLSSIISGVQAFARPNIQSSFSGQNLSNIPFIFSIMALWVLINLINQ